MHPVPDGSPRLRAWMHLHPDDGMCLMEYVSLLAASRFSDAPRCTDPLLAELARLVNDAMSDETRAGLVRFAPALATLHRTSPAESPAIVSGAVGVALAAAPHRRDLRRHHRRALRRAHAIRTHPRSPILEHLLDGLYRRGPARHALRCAVHAATRHTDDQTEHDSVLIAMLDAAMSAAAPTVSQAVGPVFTDNSMVDRRSSRTLAGRTER